MVDYRDPFSEHIDSIRDWTEFLEVLDAWDDTTSRYLDVDSAPELFSRSGRYGWWAKILASWILDKSNVSPEPLLEITRMIQAKDPLGQMTAFLATSEEIERCRQRWWPYRQILIDQAITGPATESEMSPFVPNTFQAAILNALDGRALKKQQLAEEVANGDGRRFYRPNSLTELRDKGLVEHKNGLGYYRPDAAPR